MRNSAAIKAVAIVLASVALLAAVGGGIGIIAMAESGLYNRTVAEIKTERMEEVTASVADHLVREYIKENLSNMTDNALRNSGFYDSYSYYWYEINTDLGMNGWYYHVQSQDGKQYTANTIAARAISKYGMALCYKCLQDYNAEAGAEQ